MPVPQVSPQALFNEAERHKSRESLEKCLTNLLTTGQVLDYKFFSDYVEVALDGTNKPVKLPIRFPDSGAVPAAAFETAPETKAAPKAAKAAQKLAGAPVGVVAIVGLKTESYEHHAARLVRHALKMGMPKLVNVGQAADSILEDWYKGLK